MDWQKETLSGSSQPSLREFLQFCRRSLWEACSDYSAAYSTLSTGYQCWKEFVKNGGTPNRPTAKKQGGESE